MTDDEFAVQVGASENNLVDDFVDAELRPAGSGHFVRHYLVSVERRRQLRLTESLREISARAEYEIPPAKRSVIDLASHPSFYLLRFAVFSVFILAIGMCVWRYAISQSDADKGPGQMRSACRGSRPRESNIPAPPDYFSLSEVRRGKPYRADPACNRAESYPLDTTGDPADSQSNHTPALFYLSEKKFDRAIREFDLAVVLAPKNPMPRRDAGHFAVLGGHADL